MIKVKLNNFTMEYEVTFDDGRCDKVSYATYQAVSNWYRRNDALEEVEYRAEWLEEKWDRELSEDELLEIVEIYERGYQSDISEATQWEWAVEIFAEKHQ